MTAESGAQAIAAFIEGVLPGGHAVPEIALLHEMMGDYPRRPGKSLRGRLTLLSAEAHGGSRQAALPLAAAVELFQSWVLIHDDIEDGSEERRGRPALHRLHGMPLALNAGDALHVLMWRVVLESGTEGAASEFLDMIAETAEGQHMDVAWVERRRWDLTEGDYLEMVRRKTARYTVVSPLRLGALAAGRQPDGRLTAAGRDLGVAFQVRDDVLNLVGDREAYGKEIGGDLLEGKRTLILAHLLAGLPQGERAEVIAALQLPRGEKTPEQVQWITGLAVERGSVAHAQRVADEHARRGLALLEETLAPLPGRAAAGAVLDAVRDLATRQA
ncbi:MAG TPA: polyprenyl synthetase family protein [Deinococcales bacterium]|nr:polyprenyl synthetase family protein [Deinococcales bacterium]